MICRPPLLLFLTAFLSLAWPAPAQDAPALPGVASLVRVNSTNQNYNFAKPWTKRPPYTRRGIGAVIDGGRVLVTAELVANHTYVELERPGDPGKVPAEVLRVDYDSNLALLAPTDSKFLADAVPVRLATDVRVGRRVAVAQVESNGTPAYTPGVVTTATVSPYPSDGIALLSYRISAPLQYRDNSFTLPVFADQALAGLLMRYDARSQTADLVSAPVIASFLARTDQRPYRGFPRAGLTFSATQDPQFRRYLGLEGAGGVYVVSVSRGSPAEKSGLKAGDVILEVDGHALDGDGNYPDPDNGKIPFSHLVSSAAPGGTLPLSVLRDGKTLKLTLPLEPRDPATIISETAILDRAPRYFILGGLVFTELSRSYLKEWGGNWRSDAPARLVYLDEFQDELPADQGKVVFLSEVLPADTTLGYDDVGSNRVTRVNGVAIHRLEDLAKAARQPQNGYHRIELESDPKVLFLDARKCEESAEELKRSYGLPALDNLKANPLP